MLIVGHNPIRRPPMSNRRSSGKARFMISSRQSEPDRKGQPLTDVKLQADSACRLIRESLTRVLAFQVYLTLEAASGAGGVVCGYSGKGHCSKSSP